MARARLAEVAARAGVSIATASRVLNDRPGVSPENRDAVREAAAALGYRPTLRARESAGFYGVIVPELHNPVFPAFAQELSLAFSARGATVLIGTQTDGGLSEGDLRAEFLDRDAHGLVVVSGQHADSRTSPEPYRLIQRAQTPLVLINGYVAGLAATFLSHDDARGMDLAVRHLAELGHHDIGLASGPVHYTPAQRKATGFTSAMETHLGHPGAIAHSHYSIEGGAAAAGELLDAGHTAIVCGSDPMAIGAMRAAAARGLHVPGDVSIIGHDDSLFMAHTGPGLTTVRQAVSEMAHAAARSLLGDHSPPGPELLFEPELIVRGSTAKVERAPKGRRQ